MTRLLFFLVSSLPCLSLLADDPRGLQIASGRIAGVASDRDESISVYKGIPFAAPPVGPLRWRPPQSPKLGTVFVLVIRLGTSRSKSREWFRGVGHLMRTAFT